MQRSGKNIGGYFGERIDIHAVLRDALGFARSHGWHVEEMSAPPAPPAPALFALRRETAGAKRRLYLSAGIHGDEPAGPLAVRRLLQENFWPSDADVWLCPCLNPHGFERNTRANAEGVDLNRDYRALQSAEVRAHIAWLDRQPRFDLALCLHEDWEAHGFYVYEIKSSRPDPLAARIVGAVAKVCPIDPSAEIDGRPASGGVISVDIDPETRPLWPEAVYLRQTHRPRTCTLEAPSDFALATRVAALVAGVHAAVAHESDRAGAAT